MDEPDLKIEVKTEERSFFFDSFDSCWKWIAEWFDPTAESVRVISVVAIEEDKHGTD
jgi:hypothetical protein